MKFLRIYLVGYLVLTIGAMLALWQVGALSRIAPIWIVIGLLVTFGIGLMLAVSSGKPTITTDAG
jgi:hypothetical protein